MCREVSIEFRFHGLFFSPDLVRGKKVFYKGRTPSIHKEKESRT